MGDLGFPAIPNAPSVVMAAPGAISAAYRVIIMPTNGAYTLPALSAVSDGSIFYLKYTGAASSAVVSAAGSDTIDGGSTANITLTSAGAGQGLCCIVVATKSGTSTWNRLVKPQ